MSECMRLKEKILIKKDLEDDSPPFPKGWLSKEEMGTER